MDDVLRVIRERHSTRAPFDPCRPVAAVDLVKILEAARWAPTAHNMHYFEVVVVDDRRTLAAIGAIGTRPSATFLRENYQQLAFSKQELLHKRTGLLAEMFPESWRHPATEPEDGVEAEHGFLGQTLQDCPMLLIVIYDRRKRAPASEGDVLGLISLGCVMQNIWLMADALGIRMQILSALNETNDEREVRAVLAIPEPMAIGFACRLGYLVAESVDYLRVRREIGEFTHRNRWRSIPPQRRRRVHLVMSALRESPATPLRPLGTREDLAVKRPEAVHR